MSEILFTLGPIAIIAIVFLVFLMTQYRTASPDKALIVSGSMLGRKNVHKDAHGNKIKIVRGGGTFVIPVFQKARTLSLMSSKLEVSTPSVYTELGVPISADGTVIIKIGSSVEEISTAAEQYLDKPTEELENEAREVLEGHLRSILGSMTVEEIYKNRDKFAAEVQAVASVDLAKMGLVIVSFTVKEVTDDKGYLDSLGRPQIAEVKKQAEIAEAEATKITKIQRAQAEKEAKKAENERATEIALSEKEKNLKLAAYKQEQDVEKAKADKAYELEATDWQKRIIERQKDIELTERRKQIEIETEEVELQSKRYEAEIKKKAEAERYATEQRAEANKAEAIASSEAKAREIELNGKAKSESIRAIGIAEAEAKQKLAEALREYGDAAIATLIIEALPEMIREAAAPMANIDKITVIDSGDGGGATKVAKYATDIIASTQETLKETTGLDLTDLINQYVGNKNIGSKLTDLTETLKDMSPTE